MAPQMVEVSVPPGTLGGEEFLISFEGQELYVMAPPDCKPGDPISFEMEVPEGGGATAQQIEIAVPEGCYSGQQFEAFFEGVKFEVSCPEGCGPGSMLLVEVPLAPTEPEPAMRSSPPAPGESDLVAGENVIIDGLQAKPYLNGERASLIAFDAIKGRWKVQTADGVTLALKPDNLRSRAPKHTDDNAQNKVRREGNGSPVSCMDDI